MIYAKFKDSDLVRSENWIKLIKMNRDDVVKLYDEWQNIHKCNQELSKQQIEQRNKELDEIKQFLNLKGIETHCYKERRSKCGYYKMNQWYDKYVYTTIYNKYPSYGGEIPRCHGGSVMVEDIKLYENGYESDLIKLYDKLLWQYEQGKSKANKSNKLLIESIKLATQKDIDIENLTDKEIIDKVDEYMRNEYMENEYPDSDEVNIDCCDYCDTYIIGERRCSCGNRRVSAYIDGNILDGYYLITEGY